MSGTLILIRHAESELNSAGRIDSRPPGAELSALGHEQAAALAQRLSDRTIHRVLTSTSVRTVQTATPLARAMGLEVEQFPELCETDCGIYEGRSDLAAREAYEAAWTRWFAGEHDLRVPGGESWNDIRTRVMRVLAALPEPPWAADVVWVGHGGSIRVLLDTVLGGEAAAAIGFQLNTGLIEIEPLGRGAWKLVHSDKGVVKAFDSISAPKPD